MSKRVLDINYQLIRIFQPFYAQQDTPDNINHDKYDIIMCHRDGLQDEFDLILKYAEKGTKILVDVVQESGNLDDFIDYFDRLTKTYSDFYFYIFVDSEFDFDFSENVTSLKSYKLSILSFFEGYGVIQHDSLQLLQDFEIYKKENGFLSLNGSIRTHRILMLLHFLKNNIISLNGERNTDDEISMLLYTGTEDEFVKDDFFTFINQLLDDKIITDKDYQILKIFSKHLPFKFEDEDGRRPDLELKNFYRKIINIITENVSGFDGSDNYRYNTITFTEKVWKPFKVHQIPLLLALPNSLDKIRELGFDLFDDFVDHSYDKELDHKKRVEIAFNELIRLSNLDCVDFYNKNKERFIKNHSNIYKIKAEMYLELQEFMFKNDLV
jgi:hypothetical protein